MKGEKTQGIPAAPAGQRAAWADFDHSCHFGCAGLCAGGSTAVYADGQAMPAMVTVEIGVGIDENEVMFAIYPNPAKDFININTNAVKYDYQLINSLGQVIISGTANGEYQLNISGINKGVYFLKVVADGEARINKLTVQ